MVCLGLEPGAAGRKAQMNPLSYGGTPFFMTFIKGLSVEADNGEPCSLKRYLAQCYLNYKVGYFRNCMAFFTAWHFSLHGIFHCMGA